MLLIYLFEFHKILGYININSIEAYISFYELPILSWTFQSIRTQHSYITILMMIWLERETFRHRNQFCSLASLVKAMQCGFLMNISCMERKVQNSLFAHFCDSNDVSINLLPWTYCVVIFWFKKQKELKF